MDDQDLERIVVLIGGPNGSGKSTVATSFLDYLGVETFVNADDIAKGLSAFSPERRAYRAGRIMLREVHRLADDGETFAFETTLASRTFAPWLRRLIDRNYKFILGYVWVESPDISVERVSSRRLTGGHYVAEDVIRRRWQRSVDNFFRLYIPLAHRWFAYDNTGKGDPVRIAEGGSAQEERILRPNRWQMLLESQT